MKIDDENIYYIIESIDDLTPDVLNTLEYDDYTLIISNLDDLIELPDLKNYELSYIKIFNNINLKIINNLPNTLTHLEIECNINLEVILKLPNTLNYLRFIDNGDIVKLPMLSNSIIELKTENKYLLI